MVVMRFLLTLLGGDPTSVNAPLEGNTPYNTILTRSIAITSYRPLEVFGLP